MLTELKSILRIACFLSIEVLTLFSFGAQAQNLYQADTGAGIIYEYSPNGVKSTLASGLFYPYGLAFDNSGNLYEADTSSGNIYKFTPDGVKTTFASGLYPWGLTFDIDGNLYTSEYYAGTIKKITPAGVVTTFASGLGDPLGLAFNNEGDLFVSNQNGSSGNGNIYRITPDGVVSSFAAGLSGPFGLACNNAGDLFVAEYFSGTIDKFSQAGVKSILAYGLSNPTGLALNNGGDLFATEMDGVIYDFTLDGKTIIFAQPVGYGYETFLAFGPVPEPSAVSLLAVCATTFLFWRRLA